MASGKGGTGKTTVATSLILALAEAVERSGGVDSADLAFLDCDVEEPDSSLYLDPVIQQKIAVGISVPSIDEQLCAHCGTCSERCVWNAIAVSDSAVLTFPELCHGCGSCSLGCPQPGGAISETLHPIGKIETGYLPAEKPAIRYGLGRLDIGNPMPVPVIRDLKRSLTERLCTSGRPVTVIDAPPGTSCPFIETVRQADVVVLVTEPTPFGLHDLDLAVRVARDVMGLETCVAVNRVGAGETSVERFCQDRGLRIAMRIPFDREIAENTLSGRTIYESMPGLRAPFENLARGLLSRMDRQ